MKHGNYVTSNASVYKQSCNWYRAVLIHLYVIYSCLCTAMAELLETLQLAKPSR